MVQIQQVKMMAMPTISPQPSSQSEKPYLIAVLAGVHAIQLLLDKTSDDMYTKARQNSRGGKVSSSYQLVTELRGLLALLLAEMNPIMDATIKTIIAHRVDQVVNDTLPLLRAAGADQSAIAITQQTANAAADAVKRYPNMKTGQYDITYQDRMAVLNTSGDKVIQSLVETGVAAGKGVDEIALDIQNYVNPESYKIATRPWEIIRQRFGYVDNRIPADVMPGSIQSNMFNIARTMSAEIYRQSSTEFYADKQYAAGWNWILSRSHLIVDICDDNASANPYGIDEVQPGSHNYCLCDWQVQLKTLAEVKALVDDGTIS
jgi:hypothetical protein